MGLGVLLGAAGFVLYSRFESPKRGTLVVSQEAAREAARKLNDLASPSGASSPGIFEFSEKEIDSYLHYQLSALYPKGLDEIRVQILDDAFRARARVNFDELQSGIKAGKVTVMSSLFTGVHELELDGKLTARNREGSYDILGLSLDHTEIPKPLIDLLVDKFVKPKYPDVVPNKEFALPYDIDRIECRQGKLTIYRGHA